MPHSTISRDTSVTEPNTLIVEDDFLKHGFIQLPKVLLYAHNLSRDAKLLYAILLGYAWQEQRCWPGYSRLCEDMGASENMVRKYMRELEAIGLLRQQRRGQGKPNLYTLPALRTAKIEVQEPQKTAGLEPQFSQGELETRKKNQLRRDNSNDSNSSHPVIAKEQRSIPAHSAVTDTPLQERVEPDRERQKLTRKNRRMSEGFKRFMVELSGDFHDEEHTKQNLAQARNLMVTAGVEESTFITTVYEARSVTKQATIQKLSAEGDGLRNKMPYFFAVLRNLLGLDDQTAPMSITNEDLQRALDIQLIGSVDAEVATHSGPDP